MQIIPKEEVLSRLVKTGGVPLDISLIIFDSTSAANFQRKMPNTSRLVMVFVMIRNSKSANTMAKNKLYQLQFITSPNDGFYEATIKMKNGIPSLGGELVESTLMEISHIASQTNFHFYGSIVTTYRKKSSFADVPWDHLDTRCLWTGNRARSASWLSDKLNKFMTPWTLSCKKWERPGRDKIAVSL